MNSYLIDLKQKNKIQLTFYILLNRIYKDFSIYSCPIWGVKYSKEQIKNQDCFDEIITVEDHLNSGGFGSWLIENISTNKQRNKIKSIHINHSVIGMVGNEDYLLKNNIS